WLLMLDEVQTGMGRTGTLFAFQQAGITPDVITVAKALGNGVPMGACLAWGKAAEVLTAGKHGSTFGGNPLACAAALAVLHTLAEDKLPERAAVLGRRIAEGLREALADNPQVVEVRNLGLMIGVQLARPCAQLVGLALEQGLLINVTAESTIRLLPPLILSDAEAARLVSELSALVNAFTD
ncbi:MAG: aminotransferase class III-fold pyridoxal phosphate-dependent enzyme, partial [Candidatus Methylumidiphilus sp.]